MKSLFFSSRSLSMSLPDQLMDERYKSKPKHREENVKSSPRQKFKREKGITNSDLKTDSSTFQRCKKFVSLKRFSAQDRLKRLRSNLSLQNKIIDQVCSERSASICDEIKCTETVSNACYVNKSVRVSREQSSRNWRDSPQEITAKSVPKVKYSADSRLKKIRAAFLKKNTNKGPAELKIDKNISEVCHRKKTIGPVSVSKERVEQEPRSEVLVERVNSRNDVGMDIDPDCDLSTQNSDVIDHADYFRTNFEENTTSSPITNSSITKEICKFRNERAYLALHESFAPDFIMNLAVPIGDVYIVIDTNILLSHLIFVRRLLTCDIPPYKCPIIVIPWLVLQEIDYSIKKNNSELLSRARAANNFIYEFLKKKHPRLFGQSLDDFKKMFQNAVSIDDCILQYCLKFISLEKNVILLTDDVNLSNKSMVNHLSVFTKKEFERNFLVTEE